MIKILDKNTSIGAFDTYYENTLCEEVSFLSYLEASILDLNDVERGIKALDTPHTKNSERVF